MQLRGGLGDGALCLGHGEAVARHDDDRLGFLELGSHHVDCGLGVRREDARVTRGGGTRRLERLEEHRGDVAVHGDAPATVCHGACNRVPWSLQLQVVAMPRFVATHISWVSSAPEKPMSAPTCTVHARCMHGACTVHACACMVYAWCMHAHAWCMHGVCYRSGRPPW